MGPDSNPAYTRFARPQYCVKHNCFFVIYIKVKQGESVYSATKREFFNARHEVGDDRCLVFMVKVGLCLEFLRQHFDFHPKELSPLGVITHKGDKL